MVGSMAMRLSNLKKKNNEKKRENQQQQQLQQQQWMNVSIFGWLFKIEFKRV